MIMSKKPKTKRVVTLRQAMKVVPGYVSGNWPSGNEGGKGWAR
jgi:hypothetical protein